MTVALSPTRDDHVLTFRSIESEIVTFGPVIDCVDVTLPVVPPVTSIRGLLKKPEVKTQAHSSVQLMAPCFPVSFQSLLPANEKL